MVREVRGMGLLCGIEFRPPRSLGRRLAFEAFATAHPGLFGQVLVMCPFRDEGILTQTCGNDFMVLKVAPPLVIEREEVETFVAAVGRVVERMHASTSFWTEALAIGRRALTSL